jgi:O-succinylhomoserine sulfhydrylase
MGADIVMHSGTKYLDGQGRVMAGALCGHRSDGARTLPAGHHAHAGMVLSPFNAWVVLKGLETLDIRMRAQSKRRRWNWRSGWNSTPRCSGCTTRGCKATRSTPGHAPDERPGWRRAVLRCPYAGGRCRRANARSTCSTACRCFRWPPTWATPRPWPCHPASTSHGKLTEAQRQAAGIGQGLIRVAVGLEHLDDIKADLLRGLDTL